MLCLLYGNEVKDRLSKEKEIGIEVKKMKYTIIIPHFNDNANIYRLVDSIPENYDFEILIVDDNSTLKNYQHLEELIDEKSNVVVLRNNTGVKGAGACRNIGLNHATGEWIFFADSDDLFTGNLKKIIDEYKNTNYDVIYFNPISINSENQKKSERGSHLSELVLNYLKDSNDFNEWALRLNFPNPWSKMINRKFIEQNMIRFDETIKSNDVMFSTKIGVLASNVTAEEQPIYKWLVRRGSMTSVISKEIFQVNLDVAIDRYKFLEKNLNSKKIKNAKFNFFTYIVKSLLVYRFGFKYTLELIKQIRDAKAPIFSIENSPYKLIKKFFEAKSMTEVKR